MKAIFWLGLTLAVLGLLSLVIPVPHSEQKGFTAGGISVGVETHHDEKVPPLISGAMILAGAAMMIVQKAKS